LWHCDFPERPQQADRHADREATPLLKQCASK
jgi:hypothetical protein